MSILKGTAVASVGVCVALALGGCAASTGDPTESEVQAQANEGSVQATPTAEQASKASVGTTKEDLMVGPYGGVWATPFYGGLGYGGLGYGGLGYGGLGWGYPGFGMGYPGNINGGWNRIGPF
jgi:hypothetical protein